MKAIPLPPALYEYLLAFGVKESPLLAELRQHTAELDQPQNQILPEQGQFLALLVRLLNARRAIEVGVFRGYSALWIAQALPSEGVLIGCDTSHDWAQTAREFWARSTVGYKIDLRLAPALDTLNALLAQGEQGQFDFVFIDADKANNRHYYEHALQLLRVGGVVVIDNTLRYGQVADPTHTEASVLTLRAFNEFVYHDERVQMMLVPIGDGMTVAIKQG